MVQSERDKMDALKLLRDTEGVLRILAANPLQPTAHRRIRECADSIRAALLNLNPTAGDTPYAAPNGTERPGEHWNARLIREAAEREITEAYRMPRGQCRSEHTDHSDPSGRPHVSRCDLDHGHPGIHEDGDWGWSE